MDVMKEIDKLIEFSSKDVSAMAEQAISRNQFMELTVSFVFVGIVFGRMSSHTQNDNHNENGHQDATNATD